MKFTKSTDSGTTQYRAEGASFRYMAERVGGSWSLTIRRLETVAGIRVAKAGRPFSDTDHDTLKLCKIVAEEFESLGDDYRSSEHGHRERITEATLRAYGQTATTEGETMTATAVETPAVSADAKVWEFVAYEGALLAHCIPDGLAAVCNPEIMSVGGDRTSLAKIRPSETCTLCYAAVRSTTDTETKGNTVADRKDITTEAGAKAKAEIAANIERIITLRGEGNEEGAAELEKETEAIISSLSGKGVAAAKASARAAVRDAMNQPLRNTQSSQVATLETQDFTAIPEVAKIVDDSAKRIAEGLTLSLKVSDIAKEIAAAKMEMAVLLTDKNGDPDIFLKSHAAKTASRAMFEDATKGLAENEDSTAALGSLLRAVQNQQPKARAAYVLSLDERPEDAARFERALAAKSEDTKVSDAVFDIYEIPRESSQQRQALERGGEGGESDFAKEIARLERSEKLLATYAKRADKFDGDERAKLKARLQALALDAAAKAAEL